MFNNKNKDKMNETCVTHRLDCLLNRARELSDQEIKKKDNLRSNTAYCFECNSEKSCDKELELKLTLKDLTILESALYNYLIK